MLCVPLITCGLCRRPHSLRKCSCLDSEVGPVFQNCLRSGETVSTRKKEKSQIQDTVCIRQACVFVSCLDVKYIIISWLRSSREQNACGRFHLSGELNSGCVGEPAEGQHKTSDCSFQFNIPDNSSSEPKLELIFSVYASSCLVPSRTQKKSEKSCFGSNTWGKGFKNNPRRQFIYCCQAVKLGKYFFKFHWEERNCVRWSCWSRPSRKQGQKEMKKGKNRENTSHIVSTTEIEAQRGMPVV